MKKKIAVLVDLNSAEMEKIQTLAPQYEIINQIKEKDIPLVEIVFGWNDSLEEVIKNKHSEIQWIQYPYAGVNHLPVGWMQKKNIQLTNGSGTNAHAVAESTFALILGLTRNIVEASKQQDKSQWYTPNKSYELKNKTMLIVGAGKIGEQIGALAKAFLMTTIGINRSGRKIEQMDEQYLQTELPEIIHRADIIINVLPATEKTYHLFDYPLFKRMKKSAVFVNVGRGETVSTEDLLRALDEDMISKAALDVFEEEPLPVNHPLWQHKKVLITPHIAGQVERQQDYIYPIFLKNLEAYLAQKELPYNLVELNEGY